jgi:predicted enzyme involved in methoxymalonyl-ACP biosynthesis
MKKMAERKLFIDTWFMSCRVLKRGMENYVLNSMVELAKKKGYFTIVGEYLPTAKNSLVRHHYPQLGFELQENLWKLDIHTYQNKINYINKKLEWTEAV